MRESFNNIWFNFISLVYSSGLYMQVVDLLVVSMLLVVFIGIIKSGVFRERFGYFIVLILFIAVLGFFAGFDGLIFFFLLTEFLIILLFLVISLNTTSSLTRQNPLFFLTTVFLIGGYVVYLFSLSFVSLKFIYIFQWLFSGLHDILANDLYIFYHFFFFDLNITVFYITLILSFFSIIFISFYFQYKKMQQNVSTQNRRVEVLRQQEVLKQATLKTQVRFFSN